MYTGRSEGETPRLARNKTVSGTGAQTTTSPEASAPEAGTSLKQDASNSMPGTD